MNWFLDTTQLAAIFDSLVDVVFCIKDRRGTYLAVNAALVSRIEAGSKEDVIGRRAEDFFPAWMARVYDEQDRQVFEQGRPLIDQLEQITNADGTIGWYLASKFPLLDDAGTVPALVGISQDLHTPSDSDLELANLTQVVSYIKSHLDEQPRTEELAELVGLSAEQLDRRMKRVFRLSTKKFIIKSRLEESARLLGESSFSLSEIALRCGFSDQSAFTRQFRSAFLMTPGEFRGRPRR